MNTVKNNDEQGNIFEVPVALDEAKYKKTLDDLRPTIPNVDTVSKEKVILVLSHGRFTEFAEITRTNPNDPIKQALIIDIYKEIQQKVPQLDTLTIQVALGYELLNSTDSNEE